MKKIIYTNKAPAVVGPYSQAVQCDKHIYVSGQIPVNPETGELVNESIEAQTRTVLNNIKAILNEANATLEDVVKATIFVTDLKNYAKVNEVYGEYFKENAPARVCVEVSELPREVDVEIECVAILD